MWIIPVVIIILLILLISMIWTHPHGGPWIPSSRAMVKNMLDLAQVQPEDLVYDLGCGDGRIIITAARDYGAQAVGIELDPLRWLWCRVLVRIFGLEDQVEVKQGNIFQKNLSQADVVVCYLLPETTKKLEDKLLSELKPGTRVVSNTFVFPGMKSAGQNGKARLYLFAPEYTMEKYLRQQLTAPTTRVDT